MTNTTALIQKYFPKDQWNNAYKVMMGESGGNHQAVGDNHPINGIMAPSYGLFQIRGLPGRPNSKQLLDPEFNVKYAANMFKSQGWGPWTAARNLGLAGGGSAVSNYTQPAIDSSMDKVSQPSSQLNSMVPKRSSSIDYSSLLPLMQHLSDSSMQDTQQQSSPFAVDLSPYLNFASNRSRSRAYMG